MTNVSSASIVIAVRAAAGMALAALSVCAAAAPARAADTGPGSPATSRAEDPGYVGGQKAIKAGKYAEAIPLLEGAVERDKQSADALNLLAYATRKNGDAAKSIPIYERALAIDPKHKDAHEYIGEAYLALGNLPKAKEHLARLDSLCFITCAQYRDLKKAVQEYETKGGRPASTGR
jgi:tetratricopeptide (TPR) repeat protein